MTTAFDDQILERRDRRKRRSARVRHAVGRALVPLAWFAGTLLVLCVIVGFSEARATYGSRFDWPGAWLGRAWGSEGTRPVLPFSGALLTLFCGSWLSYAGIRLLRRALRYGSGMMAIARNVVEEAVRNKIVLLLLGLLLLALAWWPWSLLSASNPQPLRYQVQGFLSFSTMVSGLLLGAVTILFGAYSVGGDIQINRTGDVFVKPLSRVGYLVGKWLGVVMLMGVILLVQGLVVWGVARHWMGQNYLTDEEDWTTVNQRVLVAREAEYPMPARSFEDIADEQLAAEVQGQTELLNRRGAANLRNDFLNGERQKFLTVQPRETNTYVFDGLSLAKRQATAAQEAIAKDAARIVGELDALGVGGVRPEDLSLEIFAANPLLATRVGVDVRGAMLQFRFKIEGTNTFGDKTRAFHLKLNGRLVNGSRPIAGPIDAVQVYDVPATYVDDAGRLSVEVVNDVPAAAGAAEAPRLDTLEFDPGDVADALPHHRRVRGQPRPRRALAVGEADVPGDARRRLREPDDLPGGGGAQPEHLDARRRRRVAAVDPLLPRRRDRRRRRRRPVQPPGVPRHPIGRVGLLAVQPHRRRPAARRRPVDRLRRDARDDRLGRGRLDRRDHRLRRLPVRPPRDRPRAGLTKLPAGPARTIEASRAPCPECPCVTS